MKKASPQQIHAAVTELYDDASSHFADVLRVNGKPPLTPAQSAELDQLAPARLRDLFKAWALGDVENTARLEEDARAVYAVAACKVLGLTLIAVLRRGAA